MNELRNNILNGLAVFVIIFPVGYLGTIFGDLILSEVMILSLFAWFFVSLIGWVTGYEVKEVGEVK